MTKILHVITDTDIGGAGRYLMNLLRYSDSTRYQMKVACPGGGKLQDQIQALGVEVVELANIEQSLNLTHLFQVQKIIDSGNFDIVHTHASFSGRIAGKLSGSKVVLTRHGVGNIRRDIPSKLVTSFTSKLFTDTIIAVSRAVKISMIEMGVPAEMIKIIHNGIDLEGYDKVQPILRQRYNISKEKNVVGILARLVPEKGCEYGIKALPYILDDHPNTQLIIVGEGYLRPSLEELARRLQVFDKVTFLGYQKNVEELVADFDVYMMPSLTEGLSLALLEVMALGKPVVVTEVGGNPEVVRSGLNGILVPPQDPKALAQEVSKLISSRTRAKELANKAKETVHDSFNASLMASRTTDIYDEIQEKAGRSE